MLSRLKFCRIFLVHLSWNRVRLVCLVLEIVDCFVGALVFLRFRFLFCRHLLKYYRV